MQDLGKFKGCAYAKFDYNPYKTYWVYNYCTHRVLRFDNAVVEAVCVTIHKS